MIGRPGIPSQTIGILPVQPRSLIGIYIAKGIENFNIIKCSQRREKQNPQSVGEQYNFIPTVPPFEVCTDSAGTNVRAKYICALMHPSIVFIPFFAHLTSLQCGDLLTIYPHASVIGDCLHDFKFFNNSTSKWLPGLIDCMKQVFGSSFILVTAVITRWTSTWISCASVLRAREALQIIFLLHTVEVTSLIKLKDQSNLRRTKK